MAEAKWENRFLNADEIAFIVSIAQQALLDDELKVQIIETLIALSNMEPTFDDDSTNTYCIYCSYYYVKHDTDCPWIKAQQLVETLKETWKND